MSEPVYVRRFISRVERSDALNWFCEERRRPPTHVVLEIAEFERLKADAERIDFLESIYQRPLMTWGESE